MGEFSGYLIGGPAHGERLASKLPRIRIQETNYIPLQAAISVREQDTRKPWEEAITAHEYNYQKLLNEGVPIGVFMWEGAPLRNGMEMAVFAVKAMTPNFTPRKVTRLNRGIIWPGHHPDWKRAK